MEHINNLQIPNCLVITIVIILVISIIINCIAIFCAKNWFKAIIRKITLFFEIKATEFKYSIKFLYQNNLLPLLWFLITFTITFIMNILNWSKIDYISCDHITKDFILFLLLIILIIIPFSNLEIFGIKVDSKKLLNSNIKEDKKPITETQENTISKIQTELKELNNKNEGSKNGK